MATASTDLKEGAVCLDEWVYTEVMSSDAISISSESTDWSSDSPVSIALGGVGKEVTDRAWYAGTERPSRLGSGSAGGAVVTLNVVRRMLGGTTPCQAGIGLKVGLWSVSLRSFGVRRPCKGVTMNSLLGDGPKGVIIAPWLDFCGVEVAIVACPEGRKNNDGLSVVGV